MELRHLRYFVAVAEGENVLHAATQKLHGQNDVIAAFFSSIRVDRADKFFLVFLRCFHFHRDFSFKYSKIALVIEAIRCLFGGSR